MKLPICRRLLPICSFRFLQLSPSPIIKQIATPFWQSVKANGVPPSWLRRFFTILCFWHITNYCCTAIIEGFDFSCALARRLFLTAFRPHSSSGRFVLITSTHCLGRFYGVVWKQLKGFVGKWSWFVKQNYFLATELDHLEHSDAPTSRRRMESLQYMFRLLYHITRNEPNLILCG